MMKPRRWWQSRRTGHSAGPAARYWPAGFCSIRSWWPAKRYWISVPVPGLLPWRRRGRVLPGPLPAISTRQRWMLQQPMPGLTVCRWSFDDWAARPEALDLVTAADVLYDPDNRPLLEAFRAAASRVLLADSRVRDLGNPAYQLQTVIEARTWPDLNEFEEFNKVRIYLAEGAG